VEQRGTIENHDCPIHLHWQSKQDLTASRIDDIKPLVLRSLRKMKSALTSLLLSALCSSLSAAEKPDVLVIIADQWSPRYVSWDNKEVRTPQLDRIAREGMIFDACYTTSPVCMPARVSLLTGLYSHNGGHALWGNATGYFPEPENAPMFSDIQRAGFTTAQIGKTHWTAGAAWKERFKNSGAFFKALDLDHVADIPGPPDSAKGRDPYSQHLQKLGLLQAVADDLHGRYTKGEFEPRASVVKTEDYHDSFTTGLAVNYIGAQPKDKPLCLVVSLHSPHPPLDAPGEYATMFDPEKLTLPANVPEKYLREGHALDHAATRRMLANYLGKMALVDDCVGRLVGAMKTRGTWENTLVIFTADHGEMMGAHGYLTKGRFYEESVRVPLVVRWPGHVKTGRSKAPVQMMDVYHSIVEAVGSELTAGRFAKSLLPIATGQQERIRPIAISEIGDKAPLRMMARDERFKYWADEEREYLFDLETDPLEMNDLAAKPEHRETLSLMREKLLTHLRSSQVNAAAGYKNKVQRLREAEAKKKTP
jgi:arylsulfatase A-like enzyme